jgi:hypothetical protein
MYLHSHHFNHNYYKYSLEHVRRLYWPSTITEKEFHDKMVNEIEMLDSLTCKVKGGHHEHSPHGCEHITRYCDSQALLKIWDIIIYGPTTLYKAIKTNPQGLEGLKVQVVTSLTGEVAFYGKVLNVVRQVDLSHDYIIAEGNFEKVVNAFSTHILMLLKTMYQLKEGILDHISISTPTRYVLYIYIHIE